jgi:FMN phosphatase YigB (HAD superfamily)
MVNLKYKYVFSDLDDTLSTCQENYDKNSDEVIYLINKYTGIKNEDILSIYDGIKINLAKKIGYSKSRYPISWVETYFQCQLLSKKEVDMQQIKSVYNKANAIHMAKVKLFPGTKEAIIKMKESGINLYIVTAGDATSQNRKIDMLGIREYFNICYVLKEKNAYTMSEIFGSKDRSRCVMIGNSKKSDILPAYENNVFGIRIKRDTWSYEEAPLPDRGFIEVNNFPEASQHVLDSYFCE